VADGTVLSNAEVSDLFRRYGFFLRRRSRMIVRDPSTADDAMQEAFVKVMKNGSGVRDADKPLLWLYRVVDRCCFDQLRASRHQRAAEPLDTMSDAAMPQTEDSSGIEDRDTVLSFLGELDDVDQQIAVLAFMDGLSQGEIAEEIGYSRVTVNKRMQGIKERASRIIKEEAS
jgi:RNA polymerase sigma factor (sigma-70 family)